jgi:hypothetical protein
VDLDRTMTRTLMKIEEKKLTKTQRHVVAVAYKSIYVQLCVVLDSFIGKVYRRRPKREFLRIERIKVCVR